MKTTNFEISKKLKEAGFEAESDYNFIERNNQKAFLINIKELSGIEIMNEIGVFIKSYDLETLIDALPKKIEFKEKEYCFWMQWSSSSDCYIMGYVCGNLRATELEVWREDKNKNSESLADTAGKMWLLLKEKGVV